MEDWKMIDAREAQDEVVRRAQAFARRNPNTFSDAQSLQVQAYRGLVAKINAATDSEMELALFAR